MRHCVLITEEGADTIRHWGLLQLFYTVSCTQSLRTVRLMDTSCVGFVSVLNLKHMIHLINTKTQILHTVGFCSGVFAFLGGL